jgi:translation initiation factor IF-1
MVIGTRRGRSGTRSFDPERPAVASDDHVGVVTARLPSALFRVTLDGGHDILAHASGDARRNFVRVLVGDRVRVALSPRDVKRGRIVEVIGR